MLLFCSHLTIGQEEAERASVDSRLAKLSQLIEGYSAAVVFTQSCYWGDERDHWIVGLNDGNWEGRIVRQRFASKDKTLDNLKSTRIKKVKLDQHAAEQMIRIFDERKFSQLDQDSLNQHTELVVAEDGSVEELIHVLTDGCESQITELRNSESATRSSYEPEHFQKAVPNGHRESFIVCRDALLALFARTGK